MKTIPHKDACLAALKRHEPLEFYSEGWLKPSVWQNIKGLFKNSATQWNLMAAQFSQQLDGLEEVAILYGEEGEHIEQVADFAGFVQVGNVLLAHPARDPHTFESMELERRLISLSFRLGESQGGWNPTAPEFHYYQPLAFLASQWKENHPLIRHGQLTAVEEARIWKTLHYPAFVALLFDHKALQQRFFEWVLRDGNDPEVLVEYPALQERLVKSALSSRIGRINSQLLQIRVRPITEHLSEKVVTLFFEGREESILDPDHVITLKNHYRLSIREVFTIFSKKEIAVGNLEMFSDGIQNWNIHHLATWDQNEQRYCPISMDLAEWWKQLPIFERLSRAAARARYGVSADGTKWIAAATATRSTPTLDFQYSHAYLEVAIPQEDGSYCIYDFGKYSFRYPTSFIDSLFMLTHTLPATIAYPDENVFYSHRQFAIKAFELDSKQVNLLMESIRQDILVSRAGNMVYQIESDNCALWTHNKLASALGEESVPDLFITPLLQTEPFGLVAHIFAAIRLFPEAIQTRILTFCHIPLGAWRGTWIEMNGQRVWKSLTRHEFWNTGIVYLPASLHRFLDRELKVWLEKKRTGVSRFVLRHAKKLSRRLMAILARHLQPIMTAPARLLASQTTSLNAKAQQVSTFALWKQAEVMPLNLSPTESQHRAQHLMRDDGYRASVTDLQNQNEGRTLASLQENNRQNGLFWQSGPNGAHFERQTQLLNAA